MIDTWLIRTIDGVHGRITAVFVVKCHTAVVVWGECESGFSLCD